PPLPERPVITVTLTATDPGGLSASVQGDFLIIWEPAARVLTQKNLDEQPAGALGPQESPSIENLEHNAEEETTTPSVTDVRVTSDAGSDDIYALGDTIRVALTFSEAVDVTGSPHLKIDMDPADWGTKVVPYESGSGTDTLVFAHEVVEPNYSTQGIAVLENTLRLNGGTIQSTSSQAAAELAHDGLSHQGEHRVNWQYVAQQPESPTVTEVTISSDAGSDRSYAKGETIRVTLRLSEAVNVTGTPRLKLDFRSGTGDEQWASFESGSGSTTLVFAYAVAQGDDSDDGVAVPGNSLELNGGAIVATTDTTKNALLAHTGLVRDSDHRVDCTEPTLLSAVAEGTTLTLTFDEALGAAESLTNAPFAVVRTPQGGSEESIGLTGAPVISSVSVTLTLASAVLDTDTGVKVSYTRPTTGSNNRLIDEAGNEAESFSDVSAMSDTTPPRLVSGQIDGDTLIMYSSEALDETWIGGSFRVTLQLYNGRTASFNATGDVVIAGNKVSVGLGESYSGRKLVAKAGVEGNLAYYIKDDQPGAKVLRDLAGNPVETPKFWAGTYRTDFIYLENITVGPPRVTQVQISSDPGADTTYGLGDTISVRVTFNQAVLVVGEPRIKIAFDSGVGTRLGDEARWAVFSGGSGTTELEFSYTVAEVENSLNMSTRGIAVLRNSLSGGTIRSVESSKEADRAHTGVGHNANHKVDIPLRLKRAELSGTTLTVHFNKPLGAVQSLPNSAFVVKKTTSGGVVRTVGLRGSPLISGHTVTLKLANRLSYTDYGITLSYNKPGSGSGNKLVDTAGVELASFSDYSVGADVTPPTLIRAEVNANRVTLVFNEPLDEWYDEDHRFRVKMSIRTFHPDESRGGIEIPIESTHEFVVLRDVQINGHLVTFITGYGDGYTARPGLDFDSRVYYYKTNDDTGHGLQDLAGNEVAIPHYNPGFWSTRWVHTVNVTR
ncbi:MAG: SwmB domain-containing protein, partial [Gemmatimonadota bacterium]|nr:SwmB domain-containing protein [Gemmatimonadota bacterium]